MRGSGSVVLAGIRIIPFDESLDLIFSKQVTLPRHPNALSLRAFDDLGKELAREVYYSIGGGFIQREGEIEDKGVAGLYRDAPYAFSSAADLLRIGEEHQPAIWEIMLANEKTRHGEAEIREFVERIWDAMHACVLRGLETEGILPGGLNVRRRASELASRLEVVGEKDPLNAMDWVNAFAMAVNEDGRLTVSSEVRSQFAR
jgi:L-serine dehydratase